MGFLQQARCCQIASLGFGLLRVLVFQFYCEIDKDIPVFETALTLLYRAATFKFLVSHRALAWLASLCIAKWSHRRYYCKVRGYRDSHPWYFVQRSLAEMKQSVNELVILSSLCFVHGMEARSYFTRPKATSLTVIIFFFSWHLVLVTVHWHGVSTVASRIFISVLLSLNTAVRSHQTWQNCLPTFQPSYILGARRSKQDATQVGVLVPPSIKTT